MKLYGILATAAAVLVSTAYVHAPASAQDEGCAGRVAKAKKKRGLSGLTGSLMGAARGDGDLGSDLTGTAVAAARAGPSDCVDAPASESASAKPASATERARREMAAADAKYPSRMAIPADKKAEIDAYKALGVVRCSACEGGTTNEGWFRLELMDEMRRTNTKLNDKMVGMAPGETIRWSGTVVRGVLTALGEEMVSGFRCKRFRLRIDRDTRSAERDTLMCWGKANEYSGSDSWVEVY
ncbi:hypothetical protein [Sphingomonas cavernae]|uniref:DUF2147 domain-containing protein n=1 Tax=Sphingomonas cavernae TaxID=2320861 RepID=A0A418WQX3_9SPHN|nr:hypothetical protein [Sphingomonas cavernae]RJF93655.1 hypothetical protein D3876_04960 [Sphingomonas cavernae]